MSVYISRAQGKVTNTTVKPSASPKLHRFMP